MTEDKTQVDFEKLLEQDGVSVPQIHDNIKGTVISASKSEVKLDINGMMTGVVRGPELYEEDDDYANLKPGDEVEATVIDNENENGELELSFRYAGQAKAWQGIRDAYANKKIVKVRIVDANKGGLLAMYKQIPGFIPVSQLAPENYPRVSGGDKSKILDKLKSFVGTDFTTKVITLDEKDEKIIFSEKEAWNELQKDVISKYRVGTTVEGKVTAVTDFGVFISFGENLEGLIHISELAWQRIDDPHDLHKVGDMVKAEVINIDGSKIFLSAKKLMTDPWKDVAEKYKIGQIVKGTVLKVNPFGLFVSLDDDIHGLAHVTQLGLAPNQKVSDLYKQDVVMDFEIVTIEPKEHRLGLTVAGEKKKAKEAEVKSKEESEEKVEEEKTAKPKKSAKAKEEEKTEKKTTKEKEDKPKKTVKTKTDKK